MVFPAEMLIDYVRVYQRDGETNIGCNPPDYPTTDYINNHLEAYSSAYQTSFPSIPLPFPTCPIISIPYEH